MKYLALIFFGFLGYQAEAQKIETISLNALEQIINAPSEKLKVINFWASWCRPCIMEMPYFDELNGKEVKVYFITLDHPEDIEKAERISKKLNIKSKVCLLDEMDADKLITSISEKWTGAIPATLFVSSGGAQFFHEQALEKPELQNFVKKYSSRN